MKDLARVYALIVLAVTTLLMVLMAVDIAQAVMKVDPKAGRAFAPVLVFWLFSVGGTVAVWRGKYES